MQAASDLDALHAIFVPVGGGGLIAGIAAYVKALKPGIKVIGVEPTGERLRSNGCGPPKRPCGLHPAMHREPSPALANHVALRADQREHGSGEGSAHGLAKSSGSRMKEVQR